MRVRKCWFFVVVVGVGVAGLAAVNTWGAVTEKQLSLSGIKAVSVFVQGVSADAKKAGLTVEQIEAEVKAKLKGAGIKVVGEREVEGLSGRPALYVNLSAPKRRQKAAFVYHVEVGLMQEVTLVRDEKIRIMSITWKKGSLGYCPARSFVENVQRSLGDMMDAFVSDWATANKRR